MSQSGFQGDSGGILSGPTVPTMSVPNSMMIALANNVPNGVNGHRAYDVEWASANPSAANSGAPVNVAGQKPVLCHPMQDDPSIAEKRCDCFPWGIGEMCCAAPGQKWILSRLLAASVQSIMALDLTMGQSDRLTVGESRAQPC